MKNCTPRQNSDYAYEGPYTIFECALRAIYAVCLIFKHISIMLSNESVIQITDCSARATPTVAVT